MTKYFYFGLIDNLVLDGAWQVYEIKQNNPKNYSWEIKRQCFQVKLGPELSTISDRAQP